MSPNYKRIFKIVGGILYTLAIGFLGFIIYPKFINLYEDPVLVTPKEIILNPKYADYNKYETDDNKHERVPEFPFTIYNQKQHSLYGIWIKILPIDSPHLCSYLTIEPETLNQRETIEFKDHFFCLVMLRFDGVDDNNRKGIWLNIYKLAPKVSRTFLLKVLKSKIVLNDGQEEKVSFKIIDYGSKNPIPRTRIGDKKKGRSGFYSKPPKTIHEYKISMLKVVKQFHKENEIAPQ